MASAAAKLGVDIGGTFTDVVLEADGRRHTTKVLTTPQQPEQGVFDAVRRVLDESGVAPAGIGLLVHGTTLATNALIERKGAKTGFITTSGFRDIIEMATESRYEQYDINIDLPEPLVPRDLRIGVTERMSADGSVLVPLSQEEVEAAAERFRDHGVQSIAVGLLHSFMNSAHEREVGDILRQRLGNSVEISLSHEVSPEMREYERFSTVCANAYVKPVMAGYLGRLEAGLGELGVECPVFMMLSGGGITTVATACEFPVRLVESGPAGGALFSAHVAKLCRLDEVLSFDMGGTTAKICFIDEQTPQTSRSFEVARIYRFKKGSGLPLRIPVVEMVEIGAGGGSIGRLDILGNLAVGPHSAGSEPGPASYGRGGTLPTVTDADLVLGYIDPKGFSGGRMPLSRERAASALLGVFDAKFGGQAELAAFGVNEVVNENMANAARVHAVESGKDISTRTLIAFGGAAPLHACRVAERIGVFRVIVPTSAGVGSAVGFLRAPVAYEVTRSLPVRLSRFDPDLVNGTIRDMAREARSVVEAGALGRPIKERLTAFMRYVGQGHEVVVPLEMRSFSAEDAPRLAEAFEARHQEAYGRSIPGLEAEILHWSVVVSTEAEDDDPGQEGEPAATIAEPSGHRQVYDPDRQTTIEIPTYDRTGLSPGATIRGPAVIVEDETSTVITAEFDCSIDRLGFIDCRRREQEAARA